MHVVISAEILHAFQTQQQCVIECAPVASVYGIDGSPEHSLDQEALWISLISRTRLLGLFVCVILTVRQELLPCHLACIDSQWYNTVSARRGSFTRALAITTAILFYVTLLTKYLHI